MAASPALAVSRASLGDSSDPVWRSGCHGDQRPRQGPREWGASAAGDVLVPRAAGSSLVSRLDRIERHYGIGVVFCLDEEAERRLQAVYGRLGIRVSLLEPAEQAAALDALWRALGEYPRHMVRRYIDGVILVRHARLSPLRRQIVMHPSVSIDVVRPRSYRGLTHARVVVLVQGHIEAAFHHEFFHRIEAMERGRLRAFDVWEHNRGVSAAWRDECFDPHGRESGAEDRAATAEALFTTSPEHLGPLLAGISTRAQKLHQLMELYVQVSGGRMGHDYWRLRTGEEARLWQALSSAPRAPRGPPRVTLAAKP